MKTLILILIVVFLNADVMLLKRYNGQNVNGWVMSEKLDGIRAYWDGKNLYTKNGNVIFAPKWFLASYPPFAIDGELWTKRADFANISSIVLSKKPGKKWKSIKHYIFDVPNAKGNLFQRLSMLKSYKSKFIKIIPQIKVFNKEQIYSFLNNVVRNGGEGIVIRDPEALYERKRSNKILKLKKYFDDECLVVGYTAGKGKFTGMLGALKCKLKNGIIIKIGSGFSIMERKNPPKIGSFVTFKYLGYTKNNLPRFPVFMRVRKIK